MPHYMFDQVLGLPRCPHCNIDNPNLSAVTEFETSDSENSWYRVWRCYACARCGGVVTASTKKSEGSFVHDLFPESTSVSDDIPSRARSYLSQAVESIHAPAGAIMLAASSVDAMLKAKGYTDGSLYARIEQAATDHLITEGMSQWAHQVRLDANDQRHADEDADLPEEEDATRCINFAFALGQFLFDLPALVTQGLEESQEQGENPTST